MKPAFARILPDLKTAIKASCGETNPSIVRDQVYSGEWSFFLVLRDSQYVGFAITEVQKTLKGDFVNIVFAHCHDKEGTVFGRHQIEEWAREQGYRGVKALSVRPGMARILCSDGYKPRFVEYVKEFE